MISSIVKIKVNSKLLLSTLRHLKSTVKGKNFPNSEITVTDGKLTFAVPGAVFSLECKTEGTCKFSVPLIYFIRLIKDNFSDEVQMTISDENLQINNLNTKIKTTFFDDDKILRSVILPINYTDADLLRLTKEGYTWEELEFNKLKDKIYTADQNYNRNIIAAYDLLKMYGVRQDSLQEFVSEKLFSRIVKEEV